MPSASSTNEPASKLLQLLKIFFTAAVPRFSAGFTFGKEADPVPSPTFTTAQASSDLLQVIVPARPLLA